MCYRGERTRLGSKVKDYACGWVAKAWQEKLGERTFDHDSKGSINGMNPQVAFGTPLPVY